MSIFTKADIEIETFHESTKKSEYVSKLYEYLNELKSQDIYVVDVSLVSTMLQESSYYGDKIYNEYMIRLVKPKYEVIVETYHFDEFSDKFYHVRTETYRRRQRRNRYQNRIRHAKTHLQTSRAPRTNNGKEFR